MLTLKHLLLAVSALSTALASPLNTITYSNVFGKHQKVHPVEGGGYIPVRYVGHDLRIAFAGHGWDHQCLEAFGARTENGQLVHVTDNCRWWQRDAIFRWNEDGTITHADGRCVELAPETTELVEAPELGPIYLIQFWDCDGDKNQRWSVKKGSHKISNVARPDLCISELGFKTLVAGVDCHEAKRIGVHKKHKKATRE